MLLLLSAHPVNSGFLHTSLHCVVTSFHLCNLMASPATTTATSTTTVLPLCVWCNSSSQGYVVQYTHLSIIDEQTSFWCCEWVCLVYHDSIVILSEALTPRKVIQVILVWTSARQDVPVTMSKATWVFQEYIIPNIHKASVLQKRYILFVCVWAES